MPATSVGDLFGRMIMDASRFEAGIDRSDRALERLERSARTARTTTGTLDTSTQRLERTLTTLGLTNSRTGQAFVVLSRGAGTAGLAIAAVATAATVATAAIIGLAVAMGQRLLRSVVSVGRFAEDARLSLDSVLGSAEQGARAFDLLNTLAGRVPQTFQDLIGASTALGAAAGGSADELARLVEIAADIQSTVPQLSLQEVASNLQRAMTAGIASAELFRERGISAMLGFQAGATVSAQETRQRIVEQWEQGTNSMVGATQRMAGNVTGLISMLEDAWFRFRLQVGQAGTFDAVKQGLSDVFEALQRLDRSGAIEALAGTISDVLVPTINAASSALVTLLDWVNENERAIREWGVTAIEAVRFTVIALVNLADIAATPAHALVQSAQAMRETIAGNFDAARDRVRALREELASVEGNLEDIGEAADRSMVRILRVRTGFDTFQRVMDQLFGGPTGERVEPRPPRPTATATRADPFAKAIERLEQGRREIAALEDALEGTSVAFDATAERAKLLETAVRSIARLDLSAAQRAQLQELIGEWVDYEQQIRDTDAAVQKLIDSLDDATVGTPTSAAFEISARDAELAREKFQRQADEMESAANRVAGAIGDAFGALVTRSRSFLEAFRGIVDAIISEVIRLTFIKEIANFIVGAFGPGIPARPAEVARPPIPRQQGGPVDPGRAFLVGESGPEIFVPRLAGTVVPNMAAVGGSDNGETHVHVHLTQNINATDQRGVRQVVEQNAATITSVVQRQLRQRGRG